ncbi:hypothetical protein DIPPA_00644 [Diplonema papillatum]|nr:hypothetical protein DIPPA_00644 [Diplonema papillatum]
MVRKRVALPARHERRAQQLPSGSVPVREEVEQQAVQPGSGPGEIPEPEVVWGYRLADLGAPTAGARRLVSG